MLRKVATNLYSAESATKQQLSSYDCLRCNVQPNLNLEIEVFVHFFSVGHFVVVLFLFVNQFVYFVHQLSI